eukprot:CAMPEP_0194059152 /NCGR_PEP_ID=MMETSP0009_2-20130614/68245_1 /TAXON_ID=210454 /ORGANISM="Grammatophora oceanica, Strain CCMP 410" /LENGTH=60 /DNA_ID=CAMNT_0038709575 /DNA_START=42 /DNA_END=221 /DNA_ORIENTATION=+
MNRPLMHGEVPNDDAWRILKSRIPSYATLEEPYRVALTKVYGNTSLQQEAYDQALGKFLS